MALLETSRPGKTLMFRADMDALPIEERTGLPFSSVHPGFMHACGHDGHSAMVLGAFTILSQMSDRLKGSVKFVFQPAEEDPGGAKPMIEAGVMENPGVDYVAGCHLWPFIPEGKVGVRAGAVMAAMDRFDLEIRGKGGHGAMPHLCVDALEVGTQVVSALQRLVSRKNNPLKPVVLTVGSFHSGEAFNVISDKAVMSGTTRAFDYDVWHNWHKNMETVIKGICEASGAQYLFDYKRGHPPVVNHPEMAELVRECAVEVVGSDNVIEADPTMGGEDMAYFLERAKGCYFFLGTGFEGCSLLHSSGFNFNEEVLLSGVEIYLRLALKLLS